jgi:hypothetical protein
VNAIANAHATASRVMARWAAIRTVDLVALNAKLKAAGLTPVTPSPEPGHSR